jgi:exopolysaccharide biosynthesis predicted pyruvyltransferase EpsI
LHQFLLKLPNAKIDAYLFEAYMPMVDNVRIGTIINRMMWNVVHTYKARFELLTSDRPVIRDRLGGEMGYIMFPIGPRRLFVAGKSVAAINHLKNIPINKLVEDSNRQVVAHAERYVWGRNAAQLRLVTNRFATEPIRGLLQPRPKVD